MRLSKHFAAISASLVFAGGTALAQTQGDVSVERTTQTQSVTSTVTINPHLSPEIGGALALAYLMMLGLSLRRRQEKSWYQSVGLHGLAALSFAGAVVNPVRDTQTLGVAPNEAVIIVDRTPSNRIDGRDAQTDKILASVQEALRAVPDLVIHTVPVLSSDGKTDLFTPLTQTLGLIPKNRQAGAILITDGQTHEGLSDTLLTGSADSPLPVHALITGREGESDRRLHVESASRYTQAGSEQSITLRVEEDGVSSPSASLPVQVLLGAEVIAEAQVRPGRDETLRFTLPRMGTHHLLVRVPARADEISVDNNRQIVTMDVQRAQSNILLYSSMPTRNAAVLRSGLLQDADMNLTHFSILHPPVKHDTIPTTDLATVALPTAEIFGERLGAFNTIILDQYRNDGMIHDLYLENLARHIEKGGSALIIAGREFHDKTALSKTPLARVLPILPHGPYRDGAFRPAVTETGKRHPLMRGLYDAQSPWGSWYGHAVGVLAPSTPDKTVYPVMSAADGTPIMALAKIGHPVTGGRVAMIASDQMFLWHYGHQGGGPAAELITRTLHWLNRHPAYDEEGVTLKPDDDVLHIDVQTLRDQAPSLRVENPDGATTTLRPQVTLPGLWRATIPAGRSGLYSVTPVDSAMAPAAIQVGPAQTPESAQLVSTLEKLTPVVDRQGGIITRITVAADGSVTLQDLKLNLDQDQRASITTRDPVLPPWVWMAMTIGFLGFAWARQSGMGPRAMLDALKPRRADRGGPNL